MSNIPDDALRETWDSVYEKSVELARLIKVDGDHFDAMVVVPRGGYYPANIVARELGFGAVDLMQAAIGSYQESDTGRQSEFQLGQMPLSEQVRGKSLLVIDEVCDTGQTLGFLTDWLRDQGAGLVRCGVLHYKPGQSQTGFKPNWSVATTENWVIYPWESSES